MKKEEILDKIEKNIYEMYPVTKPRVNVINFFSTKAPELDIDFFFFTDENNILKTQVLFLNGDYYHKNSTSSFMIDTLVEKEVISELIKFLLDNFPIISNFETNNQGISLEFTFSVEKNILKGISCKKVTLKFSSSNHKYIISDYLRYILDNFYKELSSTTLFKIKYEEYLSNNKKDIINTLDEIEIRKIIDLLSVEDLRNLLEYIPDSRLINLYNKLYSEEKIPKRLIKRLEKEVSQE